MQRGGRKCSSDFVKKVRERHFKLSLTSHTTFKTTHDEKKCECASVHHKLCLCMEEGMTLHLEVGSR